TCAVLSIHGWTFDGIGPAVLLLAGAIWHLWMQYLRYRSWLRHRDSDFAPSTQGLSLAAAIGGFIGTVGACVWVIIASM
ncbi:MAG TPA: hypothetical protein VK979_06950, partial [Guyparkeria sp.]|nr:hypothetical protein [Guyparkeria sp.]